MSGSFINGGDGGTAGTHDWLTPPELLAALGEFDIDPCASQFQPWRTAATQYTIEGSRPPKPTGFTRWACNCRQSAKSTTRARMSGYWQSMLPGGRRKIKKEN